MKIRANRKQIAEINRYITTPQNGNACYKMTGVAPVTLKRIVSGEFVNETKLEAVMYFVAKVKSNENIG